MQHRFAAMALRGLAAFEKKLRCSACEHSLDLMCATAASRARWLQFFAHSMYRALLLLLITLFYGDQPIEKKLGQPQSGSASAMTDIPSCKKCDKQMIEIASERWDKLSDQQVEQFLCSFDKNCKLTEKYKNSGGTYEQIAFQSLVVELDRHLTTCIKLFDTNKNIDFTYILFLLQDVAGHDLPWPSIITQLTKKKTLSPTEQKIFDTIKRSESDFEKKYNKTK